MLKIRMQGTVQDIQWFKGLMERHKEIRVLGTSMCRSRLKTREQINMSVFMRK